MITAGSDILASDFISSSAGAGSAAHGVVTDGAGKIDPSFIYAPTTIIKSFTAAASITAGQPVSLYYSQSDGGIIYDNSSTFSGSGTTTFSLTKSFAVASHTNKALIVMLNFLGSSSQSISSITYAGQAMTLVDSSVQGTYGHGVYMYILFAPANGTNNLVINGANTGGSSCQFSGVVYSYYNVSNSGVDGHTVLQYPSSPSSMSLTPTNSGTLFLSFYNGTTTSSGSQSAGDNMKNNGQSVQIGFGSGQTMYLLAGDGGISMPKKAVTSVCTYGGNLTAWSGCMLGLIPVTAPVLGVAPSSSASVTNSCNMNLYDGFIGFANSSVSSGSTVNVTMVGLMTGLSGLVYGMKYYLADSAGTIGIAAGTNSRKIGIAYSATEMLIVNTL